MNIPVLMLPGVSSSGPEHWQTLWERDNPQFKRIEQRDWYEPKRDDWINAIDDAIKGCDTPPVIVAHSLGCIAFAHWAASRSAPVHAALLVAPADVERPEMPRHLATFAPVPPVRFAFRTMLVASDDDLWCKAQRAEAIATAWGSEFVNVGPCGHINATSGVGAWPHGRALLEKLRS